MAECDNSFKKRLDDHMAEMVSSYPQSTGTFQILVLIADVHASVFSPLNTNFCQSETKRKHPTVPQSSTLA